MIGNHDRLDAEITAERDRQYQEIDRRQREAALRATRMPADVLARARALTAERAAKRAAAAPKVTAPLAAPAPAPAPAAPALPPGSVILSRQEADAVRHLITTHPQAREILR